MAGAGAGGVSGRTLAGVAGGSLANPKAQRPRPVALASGHLNNSGRTSQQPDFRKRTGPPLSRIAWRRGVVSGPTDSDAVPGTVRERIERPVKRYSRSPMVYT